MPRRKRGSTALWQQRWDWVLATTLDKKSAHQRSRHIALFLANTGKERLRDIDSVDLHDFLIVWGRTHTPGSTARIKTEIAGFWRWLREQHSLDLPRIAGQPAKWELSPAQARAILKGCETDYRLAQWIDGMLECENRPVGMTYNRLRRRFRKVATNAGVGWMTPRRFRHELRRRKWGRDLIQEHLAARAASPLKAEEYRLPMVQMAFRFEAQTQQAKFLPKSMEPAPQSPLPNRHSPNEQQTLDRMSSTAYRSRTGAETPTFSFVPQM